MAWLNATRLSEYLSSHRELVAQELSKASQGSISQSLANLGQTNDLGTKVDCNKSSEDESTPVSTEAPEPTEA